MPKRAYIKKPVLPPQGSAGYGYAENGANDRNRTDDLFITSELLYRLSYIGRSMFINIALFFKF